MSLARHLMALIAQRNAEPGGWDHDRAVAEPVVVERCAICHRSYGGVAHGWEIHEHLAACPGPATPDMPLLVGLDATPDHHPEHPAYAAGGFIPSPPAATPDRVPAWLSAHPPAFPADPRPEPARVSAACERWSLLQPHDAHDWEAPCDGPARCPGLIDHDECPLCHPDAALAPEPDAPSIQAIRIKGPISRACNTGGHIDHCRGCGCTCHPPLTTWSRT